MSKCVDDRWDKAMAVLVEEMEAEEVRATDAMDRMGFLNDDDDDGADRRDDADGHVEKTESDDPVVAAMVGDQHPEFQAKLAQLIQLCAEVNDFEVLEVSLSVKQWEVEK